MQYRVLSIAEAVPLLLDKNISPVVALDTEFDIETGALHGLSMAGGTPERGFFGCFWSFEHPYQTVTYEAWKRTVLQPIAGDPTRTLAMHPISVDISKLRARGLTDEQTRCQLEDTVAQAYIFDDNLPHGLKELAYCILLKTDASSYKATQREIESIRKGAKDVVKDIKAQVWACYDEHRKKSDDIEVEVDPAWPGWKRLAMSLPPGMNKTTPKTWKCGGKTGCGFQNDVDDTKLTLDNLQDSQTCAQCSKARKVKLGLLTYIEPLVEPVVQRDFDRRAHERFALYGALDAVYTLMVRYTFKPTFTPLQLEHLELETKVTHPCVTEMEERGLKIDIPMLEDIQQAMDIAITALTARTIKQWTLPTDEEPFNPGSPDQVANRMWLDWKLSPPKFAVDRRSGGIKPKYRRGKDGLCKADKLVMDAMEKKYEGTHYGAAIADLTALRRWTKLKGTYVDPILEKSRRDPDGRIHSSFWPTGARSGRFSSSDPNVENIPRPFTMPTMEIGWALEVFGHLGYRQPDKPFPGFVLVTKKKEDGTEAVTAWRVQSLRLIFIAPRGMIFVSSDLSQIENRFTAFESRDHNLLALYREWDCAECGGHGSHNNILHSCPQCGAAEGKRNKSHPDQPVIKGFVHGKDIHSATAASLGFFEKYGADGRQRGKPVNHAATYGMGPGTFAQQHGVPPKDAERDLEAWHATYPGVRGNLHRRVREDITEKGYVVMFDGHVRRFLAQKLLMDSGCFRPHEFEGTIREGVNVLMQGGTGIGMKRSMLAIRKRIIELGWWGRVFLVNQVHDELLYECDEEIADEFFKVVLHEMEHAYPELDVPVLAEGGKGKRWGEAH